MSVHSFDPEVAKAVGVNAAVIYQNILFWCKRNAANDENMHDGRAWTYNSRKAFAELFPYLTEKQVRSALKKLEDTGFLLSGNFNKTPYDRTKWYSPAHWPSGANPIGPEDQLPLAQKGQPIPDSNPDIKPDTKRDTDVSPKGFDEFWKAYPRKKARPKALAAYKKAIKTTDPETIIAAVKRHIENMKKEGRATQYIPHPATWLNNEGWADEDVAGSQRKPIIKKNPYNGRCEWVLLQEDGDISLTDSFPADTPEAEALEILKAQTGGRYGL